jgi:hypothetical protein
MRSRRDEAQSWLYFFALCWRAALGKGDAGREAMAMVMIKEQWALSMKDAERREREAREGPQIPGFMERRQKRKEKERKRREGALLRQFP